MVCIQQRRKATGGAFLLEMNPMVTQSDVEQAQRAWGDGIVAIAGAHARGEDYVALAEQHVHSLYGYGIGEVLFKPTLAALDQFRPSVDEALSYFVGANGACPEDKGFAIKGWTKVRFENAGIIANDSEAIAMGNYFFTSPDGDEVKVEFTFGYIVDADGALRIQLHHSSMPAVNEH